LLKENVQEAIEEHYGGNLQWAEEYVEGNEAKRKTLLIERCKELALFCIQKAWVFNQGARRYRRRLKILTFSGVVAPAVVGSIILSFTLDLPAPLFKGILTLAGIFNVVQIIYCTPGFVGEGG
jgi:hypothetical protein